MKRRLHIGVRPREDSYTAALQALQRVEAGDLAVQEPWLCFETLADLSQMLTAERLELLVLVLRYTAGLSGGTRAAGGTRSHLRA